MIHFRLRRSLRLAVDLLSFRFSGSSADHHPPHHFFGEDRTNSFTAFFRSACRGLRFARLQRSEISDARYSARAFGVEPRHLAYCGLLLAISLEICGCDPQGASGLNPDPSLQILFGSSQSDQMLSFYDPSDTASDPTSRSLQFGDALVDTKPVSAEARPLPWAIPESVYFVYKGHRLDGLHARQPPVATAFVLSVPDRGPDRGPDRAPDRGPGHDTGHYRRFLVTARHVVDPQWAHCSEQNPASIDLRLNRRNGGVGYETLSLHSGATPRFFTPLDSTADIAVIPLDRSLIRDLDDYKLIDVPFHLLLSDSELPSVRADQQVMTARPSGELGSYPVFDGGVLLKMPAEAVGVHCGIPQNTGLQARMLHVWFIDAGVPQGVSGAPVYTSIVRTPGGAETRVLLGVQSVAWPDKGIAGITPAPALGDLIRSALRENKLNLASDRRPNP